MLKAVDLSLVTAGAYSSSCQEGLPAKSAERCVAGSPAKAATIRIAHSNKVLFFMTASFQTRKDAIFMPKKKRRCTQRLYKKIQKHE